MFALGFWPVLDIVQTLLNIELCGTQVAVYCLYNPYQLFSGRLFLNSRMTGNSLVVNAQKFSSLAFSFYDSLRDETQLIESQREQIVR